MQFYNKKNFEIYVISLGHQERINNIKIQEDNLLLKFNIFKAIDGNLINQSDLLNDKQLSESFKYDDLKRSREIGCYLSHLNLLKFIKINSVYDYTIILEDDFIITNNNFSNIIQNIINSNLIFDIIFLGNLTSNHKKLIPNSKIIYEYDIDGNLWGAYAYLVNNKSLDKIINNINFIDKPIDIKYEELAKNKNLIVYILYPTIVDPNLNLVSTII